MTVLTVTNGTDRSTVTANHISKEKETEKLSTCEHQNLSTTAATEYRQQ